MKALEFERREDRAAAAEWAVREMFSRLEQEHCVVVTPDAWGRIVREVFHAITPVDER